MWYSMTQFISNVNNNKFTAPRPEGVNVSTVVITYSVSGDIHQAIDALHDKGASVHYTIREDGFLDQYHAENAKAFYAGKSSWHGVGSVNDYGIGIMLINDSNSHFASEQITKLTALLADINTRHGKTLEITGLGEVAVDRHIAPGKQFPWQKLAENGFGKYLDVTNSNKDCTYQLGDTSKEVETIQTHLIEHGYGLVATGEFDSLTEKVVNVFNSRYNQDQENSKCWSEASNEILDYLLVKDSNLTSDEL